MAQRLTSLIALLPGSLGQKTAAGSLAVVVASDQSAVPVSGTVTSNMGTVAADPFGATADASVAAGATGSISAKLRRATQGLEDLKTLIVLGTGSNVIGRTGHDTTGGGVGRKTVATTGSEEALAGSTAAKWVIITAETDNTNPVTVGFGTSVVGALATRAGTPLSAGQSVTFFCDDLADIFVDVITNGEGVTFTYGT